MSMKTVSEVVGTVELGIQESLLTEAEIPYHVRNVHVQNLFGYGQLFSGHNLITGPVVIQVPEEYEEQAHEVLGRLESEDIADFEVEQAQEAPDEDEEFSERYREITSLQRRILVLATVWVFGAGNILALFYCVKLWKLVQGTERSSFNRIATYVLIAYSLLSAFTTPVWMFYLLESIGF